MDTPAGGIELWARESDCFRRHEENRKSLARARELSVGNRETLVELTGRSGANGRISDMRQDIESNRNEIEKLKHDRRQAMAWSASGAIVGGGTTWGIVEAIKSLLGS